MSLPPTGFPGAEPRGPRTWKLPDGRALREVTGPARALFQARLEALRQRPVPRVLAPEALVEEGERLFVLRPWVEGQPLAPRVDPATALALVELVAGLPPDFLVLDLRPEHLVRTAGGLVLVDPGWTPEGTPPYAAPEQHGRGQVGPEAVRYQLGATLLHLLGGEAPPDALTLLIPGAEPPTPEGLPSSLSAAIHDLLDPDPARRPSPRQVQRDLGSWLDFRREARASLPPPPAPSPVAKPAPRPRRSLLPALALLLVLGLALGLLAWSRAVLGPAPAPLAAAPVASPRPAVERPSGNPLPRSWNHRKDGSRMVLVPGGPFLEGPAPEAPAGTPPRRVQVPAFYIDRFEVTNQQFRGFVQATGYRAQGQWERYATPDRRRHPVIAVSWYDAQAYAQWAGKRLPTEHEWEKAARGGDGRLYPWGSPWQPERINCFESAVGNTSEVGAFPKGASPYGVEDLCGNVFEWVDAWYIPLGAGSETLPLLRVARGGSRNDLARDCTAVARRGVFPENGALVNSGFRCALDPAR